MNNPLTADELKELREVVGKVVGCDGPYRWGIEDYVAVAEHFKAKGLASAESRLKAREQYGLLLTEQTCEVCGEKFFGLHDCSKAYAKGFQDGSKAREQEIVEWLRRHWPGCSEKTKTELEAWLQGKE